MAEKGTKENAEKPVEKLSAKELKVIALQIPDITGVHGMNREELVAAVKKSRGIGDEKAQKTGRPLRDIKKKIRELKVAKVETKKSSGNAAVDIVRRRINRLKKMTRRAA